MSIDTAPSVETAPVTEIPHPMDYKAAADRYFKEASDYPVGSMEHTAKKSTAKYLAKRAFEIRIQEYLGNTESIQSR